MTETKKTTLAEKIQKLFELAAKNPNKNEAFAAAKKAQELMKKYDIQLSNLKGQNPSECIHQPVRSYGKSFRFRLARVIADNYGVKHYYISKMVVVFYGHKTAAITAQEVYDKLFNIIHRMADSEQTKAWKRTGTTKGVYNSFVLGFLDGLEADLQANCKALQIVTPDDVAESFDELAKKFEKSKVKGVKVSTLDKLAYDKGVQEGKTVMSRKEIKQ